jgi:hypothetical protein
MLIDAALELSTTSTLQNYLISFKKCIAYNGSSNVMLFFRSCFSIAHHKRCAHTTNVVNQTDKCCFFALPHISWSLSLFLSLRKTRLIACVSESIGGCSFGGQDWSFVCLALARIVVSPALER